MLYKWHYIILSSRRGIFIIECLLSKLYSRSVLIFLLHIHERILRSKYFSIHIIFQTGKNDLPTQKWWWSYRLVGYKFQLFHYNRKKTRISYQKYHFLFSRRKWKIFFYLDDSVSIREFIGSGSKIEIHLTMFTMIVKWGATVRREWD